MSEARTEEIERRIDREIVGAVALASHPSGAVTIAPANLQELMEFAKLMSVSGICIPRHLRNNPGACLAVCMQAFKWAADPYAVANQSYEVTTKDGDKRLAYMAQLIHSIITTRAPLQKRLRTEYSGDKETRACKVVGYLIGEDEPFEYQSPPIKEIVVKNSPLWIADRDQQLHYFSTRSWGRRWTPEILLGIYTPEEMRGDIIDVEAHEVPPPRPELDDFKEPAKPSRGRRAKTEPEPEQPKAETGNGAAAEPYFFADEQGQLHEFADVDDAVTAYAQKLEASKGNRATLEAVWDNGEPFLAALRKHRLGHGHGDRADALEKLHGQLLAEIEAAEAAKAAAPPTDAAEQTATSAEPSPGPSATGEPEYDVTVPKPENMATNRWFMAARAKLKALDDAGRPKEDFARFRSVNEIALGLLQKEWPNYYNMLEAVVRERMK